LRGGNRDTAAGARAGGLGFNAPALQREAAGALPVTLVEIVVLVKVVGAELLKAIEPPAPVLASVVS